MAGLPLVVDLADAPVLVVGGGSVAERRVEALLTAGAHITLIAPAITSQLSRWASQGRLRHYPTSYRDDHLDDPWVLIVAATNDALVNVTVARAARERHRLVNVASDAVAGNVAVPARIERGMLQIAIATGGALPVVSRKLRGLIEAMLPESLDAYLEFAAQERTALRAELNEPEARRRLWERYVELAWRGDLSPQAAYAAASCDLDSLEPARLLLFAPPAQASALTLGQLRRLQQADRLWLAPEVAEDVVALCRRDAERSVASTDLPAPRPAQVGLVMAAPVLLQSVAVRAEALNWVVEWLMPLPMLDQPPETP